MVRYLWAYMLYLWGGTRRHIGIRNSNRGEHMAAARAFGRALAVNPRFRPARLARGIVLWRELNQFDEAIADFDTLLAADAQDGAEDEGSVVDRTGGGVRLGSVSWIPDPGLVLQVFFRKILEIVP